MLSAFWGSFGDALGKRSAVSFFTPAFAFWAIGAVAWRSAHGPPREWVSDIGKLSSTEQTLGVVGALLLVAASAAIVQTLSEPVLRWLEGYWPRPLAPVERRLRRRVRKHLAAAKVEANESAAAQEAGRLTSADERRRAELTRRRRRFPADPEDAMPTPLGNILRAAESRPYDRYGLDVGVCWPRLWLVLGAEVKDELSAARRGLDSATELVTWSLLAIVWTAFAWWAPLIAVPAALFAYWLAVQAASTYGDLLEATFDLHRFALFEALRWPLPDDPSAQRGAGVELSRALLRGFPRVSAVPATAGDGAALATAAVPAVREEETT